MSEGRRRGEAENMELYDICYGERYGRKRNAIWQSNAGNGAGNNQVTLTTLYNGAQREGNKVLNNQRGYPLPRKPKDTEFDVGNLVWV